MRYTVLSVLSAMVFAFVTAGLPSSASAQNASFPASFPGQYEQGAGTALSFEPPANEPDVDVVVLAWSDAEQRMVDEFAHAISDGPWQIDADKLDQLPLGRVQLQLITRNTADGGGIVRQWIEVVEPTEPPGITFANDVPDTINRQGEASIGFEVTGDVADNSDVLALAWSDAEQQMVGSFAHTRGVDATTLDTGQFSNLPLGRVQLQVMLRENNEMVAIDRVWVEVTEPAITFAEDAPDAFTNGSETAVDFTVAAPASNNADVLVLAWSADQGQMLDGFAHTKPAESGTIEAKDLNNLPSGRVQLQLLLREDGTASTSTVLANDKHWIEVTIPDDGGSQPPAGDGVSIDEVTGLNAGATLEGEVDIVAHVSGPVQRVEFTLFHDGNNQLQHTELDSPYSFLGDQQWDTTTAEAGDHTLFVDAYETAKGEPVDTVAIPFSVASQGGSDAPSDGGEVSGIAQGWTQFDPAKADRIIYVSSSQGNDNNDGLSPAQAVRTVSRGKSMLRDGRADWMLLKRGDVFNEGLGSWNKSGASADRKMLIGAYGEGKRPELRPHGQHFLSIFGSPQHLALVSLHAHASQRNPNHPDFNGGGDSANGVFWHGAGGDVHFEDCLFEYFNNNMAIQTKDINNRMTGLTLYRCVLRNSYSVSDWAINGIYGQNLTNVTMKENVFYHNGWNEQIDGAGRTSFGHNVYLIGTHNLTVEGNISAFANNHGFNLRTSGHNGWTEDQRNVTVRNNLLVGNASGISARTTLAFPDNMSRDLIVENNVITEHGAVLNDGNGDFLYVNGVQVSNWIGADVRDNLLLRAPDGVASGDALKVETYNRPNSQDVVFTRNTVHEFGGNNTVLNRSGVSAFDNLIGLAPSKFRDPNRSLSSYINANTNTSSIRDFVIKASEMRYGNWDTDLTAAPVVNYLKTGFERP